MKCWFFKLTLLVEFLSCQVRSFGVISTCCLENYLQKKRKGWEKTIPLEKLQMICLADIENYYLIVPTWFLQKIRQRCKELGKRYYDNIMAWVIRYPPEKFFKIIVFSALMVLKKQSAKDLRHSFRKYIFLNIVLVILLSGGFLLFLLKYFNISLKT